MGKEKGEEKERKENGMGRKTKGRGKESMESPDHLSPQNWELWPVTSLGLVSSGESTDGVTPIFS